MATIPRADLTKSEKDELCCVYATLLLHDQGADLSAENIGKVLAASDNKVESYMPKLFANSLKGLNVAGVLASVGSASVSAGAAAPAAASGKTEAPKEEPKKEEKEEEDALGGGLGFGDDEW